MTLKKISYAAFAAALLYTPALASDEIVVVGTYEPVKADSLGAAITVIDANEIALQRPNFTSDLLRHVPGVSVSRTGPIGGQEQIRMRGNEANHTMVLLDGLEIGDPAGFSGSELDFSDLPAFHINRLEVLRGTQGAIYGSGSIGGVIAAYTPAGTDQLSAEADAMIGSFDTRRFGGSISVPVHEARFRLTASDYKTEGINSLTIGSEKDGFEQQVINGRADIPINEAFSASASVWWLDSAQDIDGVDASFSPADTSGTDKKAKRLFAIGTMNWQPKNSPWRGSLSAGLVDTETVFFTPAGLTLAGTFLIEAKRETLKGHISRDIAFNGGTATITGAVEKEDIEYLNSFLTRTQKQEQISYAGEVRAQLNNGLALSGAVRHDDADVFEDSTTFRVGAEQDLSETIRLRGSYATGVKNPSFSELFSESPLFRPNPSLKAEYQSTWDAGVVLTLHEGLAQLSADYFSGDYEDKISPVCVANCADADFFNDVNQPQNQPGTSTREGIEFAGQILLWDQINVAGGFTYVAAKLPNGNDELRRPRRTASLSASTPVLDGRGAVNIAWQHTGNASDFGGRRIPSYAVVSASGQYQLSNALELYARADNLLDEDYVEVLGFQTPGRSLFAGVRAKLGN